MNQQDTNNQYIPSFEEFENRQKSNPFGIHISPTRILSNMLRYWYVIVLSVFIALGIAWAVNRYTKKLFPVKAQIMIKESQEVSGAEILYSNALVDQYRNYYNELYFLESYPVMEQVIKELKLYISFIREGNIKDSEVYGSLPANIEILSDRITDCSFIFNIVNSNGFTLTSYTDNVTIEGTDSRQYQFGDTVRCNRLNFVIHSPDEDLDKHLDREYLLSFRNPERIAGQYINRLNVAWTAQGSSMIDLAINGYTPEKEVDFLSKLIEVYQQRDLERKNQTFQRSIEFIRDQMGNIADSLKVIEAQMMAFKSENYITDLSAESQRLFELLEEAQRSRTEILVRENYYKYLEEYVKQNENLDQVILPATLGIGEGILSGLVQKMLELQLQAKSINRDLKSENPFQGTIESQIKDIRTNILESMKGFRQADSFRLEETNRNIQDIERQLRSLPSTETELISIKRNYSLLEGIYIFLLQKLAEARISEAGAVSDIQEVNPPRASGTPIKPKPVQNYTIALLLGLFIPSSAFALKEFFNNKVQSKDDITRVTEIPFLGAVGHNYLSTNLVVNEKPRSSMAEAFRSLRSNLSYFVDREEDCKTFMVTSSVSGEGKTFTSINLGTVFAISGKKTLLLGADLRKPRIFDDFKITNDQGLSNYLSGQKMFKDVLQNTFIDNLDVISAGPVPPNPSELMLRSEMDQFFKEAKEKYEVIIVDTPPLDIVTDAFSLSKYCDHTMFIVRQSFTPLATVQKLMDITNKVPSLSIVLNDIRNTRAGYGLGYGYHYGYGYGKYGQGSYGYYGGRKKKKDGYGYYED